VLALLVLLLLLPVLMPLYQASSWAFMASWDQLAASSVHCCLADDAAITSGGYYNRCALTEPRNLANNEALASALWERSEEAVAEFL